MATMDFAVRVPPLPVYLAQERYSSLSDVLVDFEAYLLDESGKQAEYALLLRLADLRLDEKVAEQKRLQAEAALEEATRRREASALEAAMMRDLERMEVDSNGWLSEEESELDSESSSSSSSSSSPSSSSESSSSSYSEVTPFQPRTMNLKTKKPPSIRTPRQQSKPYARPTSTPDSDTSSQDFIEFFTPAHENAPPKKMVLSQNEYWVHCIDWANAPPTWDGKPIPAMAADDVVKYLQRKYDIQGKGGKVCKMGACAAKAGQKPMSNLRAHIFAREHLNLRVKCHSCRYATRDDMFKDRHRNKCAAYRRKNAEAIRRDPGVPVPSYTWEPTDFAELCAE